MTETESDRYERIAKLIETSPEWFQSNEFDDEDLIDALLIAANHLRNIGK